MYYVIYIYIYIFKYIYIIYNNVNIYKMYNI